MKRAWFVLWIEIFFREALRGLIRNKLRSSMTSLGIMIGVAGVVLSVAVGQAGQKRAENELAQLGENFIWVEAGSRNTSGVRTGTHGMTSLTIEDAEAIRNEVPLILRVSPQIDGNINLVRGNRNWTTRFRGETPEYLAIKNWGVVMGTPFSHEDVEQSASKVLIGNTVREHLFGNDDPIGQTLRSSRQLFEVVGVLATKGQSGDGRDQDDWILLPYTTAKTKLRGIGPMWLDDILCSAVSPAAVNPAIDQIIALLRQRHHIQPGSEDDFNIRRPDEILKAKVEASNTLAALLLSVASISLLVGGIGIMNVMLAAVAQRTREIGIRLAVGATRFAVQLQFLGESVLLSLAGGLAGILAVLVGASGFAQVLHWTISISPHAVVLAIACSVGVGLCSGVYPARRAALMNPIDALRGE
jgi:putative ABC transport system permease protein